MAVKQTERSFIIKKVVSIEFQLMIVVFIFLWLLLLYSCYLSNGSFVIWKHNFFVCILLFSKHWKYELKSLDKAISFEFPIVFASLTTWIFFNDFCFLKKCFQFQFDSVRFDIMRNYLINFRILNFSPKIYYVIQFIEK